jgi:hypothetical protein
MGETRSSPMKAPRRGPPQWRIGVALLAALLIPAMFSRAKAPPADPSAPAMRFSHKAHEKEAECGACHAYADTLASAGVPTLADCLDCHEGVQSKDPDGKREEAKLEIYAKANREIPWTRLPPLTPDTYFSHQRHVAVSKIKCSVCHGAIAKTDALPTSRPIRFTMDWCMHCHEKRSASVDCLDCHR